jgi:tetratricopeptide (TPR) repeat protein
LPNTLVNMAIGYYETGQLSEAAYSAEEALRRDESSAPAHTVLAAVALASQRPEAALPHLLRAITLDAGYGQAYYYLGLVHETLGQPAEAITAFEKALVATDHKPTQSQIRLRLQQLYASETQGGSP